MYRFYLSNYEKTTDEHMEFMQTAKDDLAAVASGASSRDLAQNLVYWAGRNYISNGL